LVSLAVELAPSRVLVHPVVGHSIVNELLPVPQPVNIGDDLLVDVGLSESSLVIVLVVFVDSGRLVVLAVSLDQVALIEDLLALDSLRRFVVSHHVEALVARAEEVLICNLLVADGARWHPH